MKKGMKIYRNALSTRMFRHFLTKTRHNKHGPVHRFQPTHQMQKHVNLSRNLMMEKFVLSVKKEALALPLLPVLLKLFIDRSLCRRFLGVFDGIKAFVLEQPNNLFNI